ncbi:MAG: helix-turn-helix domain-containing protein [Janthinobacterium lividum]
MRNTHFISPVGNAQGALRLTHPSLKIKPMKTGEKIRLIRESKGLKLADMENAIGLSNGNLSRIERGTQWINEEKLYALATAMGVPVSEFFTAGDNFEAAREMPGKLPLISWVQAGEWEEAMNNFQPGDAEDWLDCPFKHGPRAFILKVVGDSMFDPEGERSYKDGEFIAVDPDVEARHKSRVIVRLDDQNTATFKQLLIEPDGSKLLVALNRSWPNRIIPVNGNATICGVIIGKWVPE